MPFILLYYLYLLLVFISVIGTFLPATNNKHWFTRTFDYIRIQLLFLQIVLLIIGLLIKQEPYFLALLIQLFLSISIVYHLIKLLPYFPLKTSFKSKESLHNDEVIKLISVNVWQNNSNYQGLIDIVNKYQPDILLTMESDLKWDKRLSEIECQFKHKLKIPLDNTYGMHFYTRLDADQIIRRDFLTSERPSIEAHLKTKVGIPFRFFGVHPPPPSPTEETTANKKDGELMLLAKEIRKNKMTSLVAGDFNSVCWSKSSQLFAQTTAMIDARKGRGFFSTFPAKYKWFRFPIDLLYHSKGLQINDLKTLEDFGSDHLPIYVAFTVLDNNANINPKINKETHSEMNELIDKGMQESFEDGE